MQSNLSPQQALTSTRTPPQPSWLSSQRRLQLLSPALQQSPVKPASSLEVSSRKWGRHLCGEMLTCSVGAAQASPASPRAAPSWTHASSSSVPAPSLAALRQGQALCGSWLWPRAQQPVGAGGQAEVNSPCALPHRPCASFMGLSPAEMDFCFAAHTDLCILITIKTSQPVPVMFLCCFPDRGTWTVAEWSFWHKRWKRHEEGFPPASFPVPWVACGAAVGWTGSTRPCKEKHHASSWLQAPPRVVCLPGNLLAPKPHLSLA